MENHLRTLRNAAGAVLLALAAAGPAAAQPAYLVQDFDTGTTARAIDPRQLTVFGDQIAMAAEDPAHGTEPWLSDGSAAGTRRLADLLPGPLSSFPLHFVELGDRLLFTADENSYYRIYSHSAQAGTLLLARIEAYPVAAAKLGSRVYYHYDHPLTRRRQIYESDGTLAGTRRLLELCPQAPVCFNDPQPVFSFDGAMYFAFDGTLFRANPLPAPRLSSSPPPAIMSRSTPTAS